MLFRLIALSVCSLTIFISGCQKQSSSDVSASEAAGVPFDPDRYERPADAPTSEELKGTGDETIPLTASWPGLRGVGQRAAVENFEIVNPLPETPRTVWHRTSRGGYSSLSVGKGLVFTATKDKDAEIIQALELRSGKVRWEFAYPAVYQTLFPKDSGVFTRAPSGPRATPTLDGDHLYFVGTMGSLHCLEAATGKAVWKTELSRFLKTPPPLFGFSGSALVFGNGVFVQTGGTSGDAIAKFDKLTGELLWKRHDDPYSYSTPLAVRLGGKDSILFFTGSGLLAVDPENGEERWRYGWTTQENQNTASPLVLDDKVFISSGYGSGGALIEISQDGSIKESWKTKSLSTHFHGAVFHDGFLYGFSDQRLRCVDIGTGKTRWDKTGFGRGSVLVVGEKLLILSGDGELILAEANPDRFSESGRAKVLERSGFNAPTFVDGVLLVRNEWEIVAIDLRPNS